MRGGHKRILTCAPVTKCNCFAFSLGQPLSLSLPVHDVAADFSSWAC